MYLISAYFDKPTEQTLTRHINQIVTQTGNTFMTDNHVPPHLTISSLEARSVEVLLPCMEQLRDKIPQGTVSFVSIGALLPYVLYVTPVLNTYLQELSQQICSSVSQIADVRVSRFYRPMQWLPHVTLGKTLTKEQLQTAFAVMQERFVPFDGKVVSLGLAKTNPHEDLWTLAL